MKRRGPATEQRAVDGWNARHDVGQAVEYWTFTRDADGTGKLSTTRSPAQMLGGTTAVVWVEGEPGCIALTHVRPIEDAGAAGPIL